jgi:uncharacterized coiled-coil DUF342 family protein
MGASGLKIVESYLSRHKEKIDEASVIRGELRAEVDNLRKLIKDTEAEVDEWRNKYYALLDDVAQLRAEATAAATLAALKSKEAEDALKKARVAKKSPPRKRGTPVEREG